MNTLEFALLTILSLPFAALAISANMARTNHRRWERMKRRADEKRRGSR